MITKQKSPFDTDPFAQPAPPPQPLGFDTVGFPPGRPRRPATTRPSSTVSSPAAIFARRKTPI